MSDILARLMANVQPRELIATQTVLFQEDGTALSVVGGVLQTSGNGAVDTIGFQSITVSTAALSLTPTAGATRAVITVADADVRFRADGTNPTTSVGHVVFDGGQIILQSAADIASFRVIRDGAVDAILSVSYLS